ncbi:STAS domain-containing protein [Streptomyces sp. Je 1-79]|uniref:STAS domain-containing protein n=1 Tax=Streptomyces sp. Je 1-79 TaxID=2943847 RepID=UPI0021A3666C|nr:STAS domain-containing protein [Streptomyces sp. Je 1-79]MCT4353887.1 STAS domain-containing protein [Streptomyces sp. Je 1-79]
MAPLPDSARPALQEAEDGRIAVSVTPTAGGGVLVKVCGELDLDSVTHLRTTLLHALAVCDGAGVALDLSGVTFCDSIGLNALLRARMQAADDRHPLTITAASPQVTRLLEITGAAPLFESGP